MGFLIPLFYVAVTVTALVVRVVRARGGSGGPVHDRYEVAFLNGGPARVADTALAALHADGRIAIGGPGVVAVVRPAAHDPVERAVLQEHAAAPHGALHHLRLAVMRHPAVQETGDGLSARGLLVDPATRRATNRWCLVAGVTAFVLFPVSIVITVVDFANSPEFRVPFVFAVLPALLATGVTALVCGNVSSARVGPAGRRAVSAYGRAHGHLADAGTLVALHGLRALPDPALREQLLAAARITRPRGSGRGGRAVSGPSSSHGSYDASGPVAVWCAGADSCGGGGGGGSCSSGSCSSGSGCGGSSSSCGGGSSSCGGSSSSCSSSSSSSCSSSGSS